MTTEIDGWYTTREIMDMFSVSRQRVSVLAQRRGWTRRMIGNSALYAARDVNATLTARMAAMPAAEPVEDGADGTPQE